VEPEAEEAQAEAPEAEPEAAPVEPEAAEEAETDAREAEAEVPEPAVELHAQAPPQELRPPWLSETEVDDETSLEAKGRAAVDDVIAHGDAEAGAESEATPENPPADSGGEPSAPDEPAGDSAAAPMPPLEPRLEPLPEPWRTVWRPGGRRPDPTPAPPAEAEPKEEPATKAAKHEPAGTTAAPAPASTGPGEEGWSGDRPLPEVEEAVARLRGDLFQHAEDPGKTATSLDDYREAIRRRPRPRRGFAAGLDLSLTSTQLKFAAVAAAIILVLGGGIAAALALNRAPAKNSTAATRPKPAAPASSAPTSAAGGAPSAAPSAAVVPQLTGPVTVGSGGSAFTVQRIRTGSPGAGTFRMVLDLQGSGPLPTAQLGHGPDGADYLVASGISIDPTVVQAFAPGGLVTGLTQAGSEGLNLRLAMSQNPPYGIGYLTGPTRLVIDFK
jgi:hypothetical protein